MEAGDVERLAAPRVHRLVRHPRQRERAAERGGHEVRGLPSGAWTGAAERRERHLHESWVRAGEVGVIETEPFEPARALRLDDQVGVRGELAVGGAAVL